MKFEIVKLWAKWNGTKVEEFEETVAAFPSEEEAKSKLKSITDRLVERFYPVAVYCLKEVPLAA